MHRLCHHHCDLVVSTNKYAISNTKKPGASKQTAHPACGLELLKSRNIIPTVMIMPYPRGSVWNGETDGGSDRMDQCCRKAYLVPSQIIIFDHGALLNSPHTHGHPGGCFSE